MTDRAEVIRGLEDTIYFLRLQRVRKASEMCIQHQRNAIAMLNEQPDIVRCKDCKHATLTADGIFCKYCEMDTDDFGDQRCVYHDAVWFCADGERKVPD